MAFQRARKAQSFLRLALAGPSGSGKTYTALSLASALANGQPFAVVDTERGSASKYADLFTFDVLELDNFAPEKYIAAIQEAVQAGYTVIVLDSLSHAWNGAGGILEKVQSLGGQFQSWAKVKPVENRFLAALTGSPIHIIGTMRTKTEYTFTQEGGKNVPQRVGMAPVQRDGIEYEFDVFGDLDETNTLTVRKSRCVALAGAVISKPGKQLAATLAAWLTGEPPTEATTEPTEPAESHSADGPTPAQLTRATHTTFAQIRQSAIEKGLSTQEAWDTFCTNASGKDEVTIKSSRDTTAKAKVLVALDAFVPDLAEVDAFGHQRGN